MRDTLAQLPRGAYVINTARGPCVDLPRLAAALDKGQVAYAALDVVEREPLDDEELRCHPRVLLTPHAAFYSVEGFHEMRSARRRRSPPHDSGRGGPQPGQPTLPDGAALRTASAGAIKGE